MCCRSTLPPTLLALALCLGLSSQTAWAHRPGESFLFFVVHPGGIEGRIELALKDLNLVPGADRGTKNARDGEDLAARLRHAEEYLREHVKLSADGVPLPLEFLGHRTASTPLGNDAIFDFKVEGSAALDAVDIEYTVLFARDPNHKGFVVLEHDARRPGRMQFAPLVLSADSTTATLRFDDGWSLAVFGRFFKEGVWHIWIGVDHILFLLALLLPAVLTGPSRRDLPGGPPAVDSSRSELRAAFLSVVRVVTLFTVAHSITLCLAALDLVRLPSRLVESVIAISIAVAALNNIFRFFPERTGWIVCGFGLFHGFGFASVLAHLGLQKGALLVPLFAFNVGVEAGQIAIIAAVFPVLYALRSAPLYQPVVLRGGSAVLVLIALYWCVERMAGE